MGTSFSALENKNSLHGHSKQEFYSKVHKIGESHSDLWGYFDLYQMNEKPYDYLIEYKEVSMPNQKMSELKQEFYRSLPQNKNLVQVMYCEISQKKLICAEFDQIKVYCQYYNFTIEDAIKLKIKQKGEFKSADIYYVLKSFASIGQFYQQQTSKSSYSGIFKAKHIFVTPQGHIKIYPFNQNLFQAFLEHKNQPTSEQQYSPQNSQKFKKSFEVSLPNSETLEYTKKVPYVSTTSLIGENNNDFKMAKTQLQTREQSSIFRSDMLLNLQREKKAKQAGRGKRTAKITTTLCGKNTKNNLNSQNVSNMESRKPSYSSINSSSQLYQDENRQASSVNLFKNNATEGPLKINRRDMFDLGILVLQLLLLNDEDYYFKYDPHQSQTGVSKSSRVAQQSKQEVSYLNENGKIPNMDLIKFSFNHLLPNKALPEKLLNLISTLLFSEKSQIKYSEIQQQIENEQQYEGRVKYCLKFDPQDTNVKNLKPSNYLVRDQSVYSNGSHLKGSRVDNQTVNKHYEAQLSRQPSELQESLLKLRTLEGLLGKNALSQSFVTNEEGKNINAERQVLANSEVEDRSFQMISKLKKSRKLVPSKIRSVSMQVNTQQQQNP